MNKEIIRIEFAGIAKPIIENEKVVSILQTITINKKTYIVLPVSTANAFPAEWLSAS